MCEIKGDRHVIFIYKVVYLLSESYHSLRQGLIRCNLSMNLLYNALLTNLETILVTSSQINCKPSKHLTNKIIQTLWSCTIVVWTSNEAKVKKKSMIIQRLKIKWASETCINYSIFPTSKGFFVCRGQVLVTCWEGIYILCILHYLLSFYGTNNSISQQCLCILVFRKRFLKCIKLFLDNFRPKHVIT